MLNREVRDRMTNKYNPLRRSSDASELVKRASLRDSSSSLSDEEKKNTKKETEASQINLMQSKKTPRLSNMFNE